MADRQARQSITWKFFTDAGEHRAKCNTCGKTLSYKGGGPFNLTRHTKSQHPDIYVAIALKHKTNTIEESNTTWIEENQTEPQTSSARAPSPSISEESDLLVIQKSSTPPRIEVEIPPSPPRLSKVEPSYSKKAKLSHEVPYTDNYLDMSHIEIPSLRRKSTKAPPTDHSLHLQLTKPPPIDQSTLLHSSESVHICATCPCIAAQESEFDKMGKAWASEVKKMTYEQQIFAKRYIAEIIFEGQLGGLHRGTMPVQTPFQRTVNDPLHEEPSLYFEKGE